jgi:hypothetical protein
MPAIRASLNIYSSTFSGVRRGFRGAAVAVAMSMAFGSTAQAQVYWDGTSGTWGTAGNWSTGSSATTPNPSLAPNNLTTNVVFNITTANSPTTVTLGTDQSAQSLTFNTTGSTTLIANGTARTLNLGVSGVNGITMASTAGPVTFGDGTAGNNVLLNLATANNATWTNNSSSNFTVNSTTTALTRVSGATLRFVQAGSGVFAMTTAAAPNVNGILGPWALFGTGTNTRYAFNNSGTIAGLAGTAAANATSLTDTTGTVNYDLASGTGTIGAANFSANTLRYTGGSGTLAPGATSFSLNGILNAGTGRLTIGTSPLTIGANKELVVYMADQPITISSPIADNAGGASSLTVVGGTAVSSANNRLTLSASNSFTGGLSISGLSSVSLTNANAAGSGTIALRYQNSASATTVLDIAGGLTVANPIVSDSNLQGRAVITTSGSGVVTLTGNVNVNSGAFIFDTIAGSSASFVLSGSIIAPNAVSLRGNGGVINGGVSAGALMVNNTAGLPWTINSTGNTITSVRIQSSGNLILGASNALPTTAVLQNDTSSSTGALDLNGSGVTLAGLYNSTLPTTGNGGRITNNSSSSDATLTLAGLTTDYNFYGAITDGTASRKMSLVLNSPGRAQILSGTDKSTYSGSTAILSGTLRAGAAGGGQSFGNLSALTLSNTSGATLDLNGFNQTIGSLAGGGTAGGNVTLGTATLTAGGNNTSTTYAGVISGSGGLSKAGSGILTLSGSSTFSGATTVSAGQLQIGSAGAINSTSGITVNGAGAEFKFNAATALLRPLTLTQGTLSGTGTIGTAVTVGSNAILSPGNSPGIQSFTQGLTFDQGGQYIWEINNWAGSPGTGYDQLVVSGSALNVTANSGSTFKIAVTGLTAGNVSGAVPGFVGTTGTTFTIATSSAGITGFDKTKFTIDPAAFTNNNTLPTNAGFWVSQSGNNLLLNYNPSATYNLSAAATATALRVGGTSWITATVTSSTAAVTNPDSLAYGGLALSGGLGSLSSTSGTLTGGLSASGSAAFAPVSSGSYAFNPSVTSGSNVNIGTSANAGSTSGVSVNVYNVAAANTFTGTTLSLGNVRVGDAFTTQNLAIWNTATAATGFQEGLATSITGSTGGATGAAVGGNLANLITGTNNFTIGLGGTGSAGAKSGSVTFGLTSTGTTSTGATGLSPLALSAQTVNVTGTVWNLASANTITTPVSLGNIRVGGTFGTQALSIQNTGTALYTEGLKAAFGSTSGAASGSGSIAVLASGSTNNTSMTVGLGSGAQNTAGLISGTQAVSLWSTGVGTSGLSDYALAGQNIAISGTVWNAAAASIASGTSINFGTVLKGTSLSQALSITNTAPNTYSEKLDANFGSPTGDASTNGGLINLLTAGGTSAAMSVGLNSATAGGKTGSVQVNFATNGDGTSGLGTLALAPQTVNLVGTVLDPAVASFTSGSIPSTTLSLDFFTVNEGDSVSPQGFSLYNLLQTAGYTADLALTNIISSNPTGPFSTNLSLFSNLASGSSNSWQVFLNTGSQGTFSNTWTLQFKSANAGSVYTGDSTQTLTLSANVIVVPEPGALALAGLGIGLAGWLIRRRK